MHHFDEFDEFHRWPNSRRRTNRAQQKLSTVAARGWYVWRESIIPDSPKIASWSPDGRATDPESVSFTMHDSCLTQGGCQFESCQTSNDFLCRSSSSSYCRSAPGFHSWTTPRNFTGDRAKKGSNTGLQRRTNRSRLSFETRALERIRSGPTTQFRREDPRGPRRVLIAGYGACN